MPKKKEVHLKKLVGAGNETEKAQGHEAQVTEFKNQPIVSYWHSNLTIGIVSDNKPIQLKGMPAVITQRIHFKSRC